MLNRIWRFWLKQEGQNHEVENRLYLSKAVTIVEKLKEGNASIFICGKSGVGKSTLSYDIIRGLLESGVRIVVIDHRHAVSFPVELEPYVHRQDVSQKPLKLHLFGASDNPADAAASFADTITSVIALSNAQEQLLRPLLKRGASRFTGSEWSAGIPASGRSRVLIHALRPVWKTPWHPYLHKKLFEDGDVEFSPGITLLDLSSFSLSTQHIVEEVLFAALLREATCEDFPPTFLYLDELSNYPLRSSNALGRILCEGRKQGLYALLVAQSIRVFKSEQRILLQQCKYMMCFQPADEEVRMCARLISSSGGTKLTSMLKSLQVGEFMVSGPVYVGDSDTPTTKPLVVHSKSPEDVVPANWFGDSGTFRYRTDPAPSADWPSSAVGRSWWLWRWRSRSQQTGNRNGERLSSATGFAFGAFHWTAASSWWIFCSTRTKSIPANAAASICSFYIRSYELVLR